jgi:hypothetical protein
MKERVQKEAAGQIFVRGAGALQSAPDLREGGDGPMRGEEDPSSSTSKTVAFEGLKEAFHFVAEEEESFPCSD